MKTIVLKFGGASVATPQHFSQAAQTIIERSQGYQRTVAVVSAMGTTTDELIALAREVHPEPPRREHDMLVSVGERISIALLSMALTLQGRQAVSFTGSQSGIITSPSHTNALIKDIKPHRLIPQLDQGKIVIVAGFQGVSTEGEITTLGRGGGDTTAVALGVALRAEKVEFFKDVGAVYDRDPKKFNAAQRYPHLPFEKALELSQNGAKILSSRCLALAYKNQLPLHVLPYTPPYNNGTYIGSSHPELLSSPLYEE
ncbi:MAG: aspartate kinase [Chlamydiota bacterium]